MKVERIEQDSERIKELQVEIGKLRSQFQPVHIVIETQDEVDQFCTAIGSIPYSVGSIPSDSTHRPYSPHIASSGQSSA